MLIIISYTLEINGPGWVYKTIKGLGKKAKILSIDVKHMRVVLFSGNYNYVADGANKALNRLVRFMEDQGVTLQVYSPTSNSPAFEPAGTLISVPSVPVPGRGEYRIGFGLSDKLKTQIKAFDPHLFHLSAPDLLGHSALKFSETLGVPAVASFHTRFDTYFKYYGASWIENYTRKKMARFYARCQRVYVPSRSVGDQLIQDNILDESLRIWSRGIERDRFNPEKRSLEWRRAQGIADNDIALTFVGRLVKEKGLIEYANLVDALEVKGHPIKALIIGEGPEREALQKRLPSAIFTGHMSGEDLTQAYACGDIFINPSLTETFGNVTLEAMASGLPAICSIATGSIDLVKDGQTGFLVENDDLKAWVERTDRLISDRDLLKSMGNAARIASADYDWSKIMHGLLGEYIHVIDASGLDLRKAS